MENSYYSNRLCFYLSLLICLTIHFTSKSQNKSVVVNYSGYYTVSPLYTHPKGGDKNPIIKINTDSPSLAETEILYKKDTQIIVYVETTKKVIFWKAARQGKQVLQIDARIISAPFYAGILNGGKQLLVNVKSGNFLFALHLKKNSRGDKTSLTNAPVYINAIFNNKYINFKTKILIELLHLPPT